MLDKTTKVIKKNLPKIEKSVYSLPKPVKYSTIVLWLNIDIKICEIIFFVPTITITFSSYLNENFLPEATFSFIFLIAFLRANR